AYLALVEAEQAMSRSQPFRTRVSLHWPVNADTADPVQKEGAAKVIIEAVRAGLPPSTPLDPASPGAAGPCFGVSVSPSDMPVPVRSFHYHGVYFAPGEARISSPTPFILRLYAATYRPGMTVILDGYADTQGEADDNMALSRRRVEAVADAFIGLGVPEASIEKRAFGEAKLARATADGTSEPLNRRVWIDMRMRGR
ncbi:hypothetical protein LTR94_025739, partial [Friedmanniomyces endolithicus]